MEEDHKALVVSATDLLAPSNAGSTLAAIAALPETLTDDQWEMVGTVCRAPLPEQARIGDDAFAEALKLIETLPRRRDDAETGELRYRIYERGIRHLPAAQIWWTVDRVIRECRFCPTVSEFLNLAEDWTRKDEAVQAKREASLRFNRERVRRMKARKKATRPLTQEDVDKMDGVLISMGLKAGALIERDGKVVPAEDDAFKEAM